jgi:hypothetical protein
MRPAEASTRAAAAPSGPPAFHLLAKPTGATCNLDCEYCFFLSKEMLYPGSRFRMADEMLEQYVRLARGMEVPATFRMALGTDAVDTAEALCLDVAKEFPKSTFFSGKMVFQRERWYHALLHNNTALALQKRLQWAGKTMVTLPVRLREA